MAVEHLLKVEGCFRKVLDDPMIMRAPTTCMANHWWCKRSTNNRMKESSRNSRCSTSRDSLPLRIGILQNQLECAVLAKRQNIDCQLHSMFTVETSGMRTELIVRFLTQLFWNAYCGDGCKVKGCYPLTGKTRDKVTGCEKRRSMDW